MDTKTVTGIFGALAGAASLLFGLLRVGLPRQKRVVFLTLAVSFFVYGALEYFGIIHLESWR
jgi:hypothetical protein